jgi:ribosomal protein S18 acetylase RimI-like enzyme
VSEWTISVADDPEVLVRASHLFDQPVSPEGAEDFLRRPGHVLLIATSHDDEGIGFVSGVEMRHPDKDPEMFIYELGVDESWRRRGVAKALLSALRDEAVQRGCRGMWTGTEADNEAALTTYRSLGATVDDESVFITWDDLTSTGTAAAD